jgi:hypothetical protein
MKVGKWLLSTLIVWIVHWVVSSIVHGAILAGYYGQTASHWLNEPQMQSRMWAMILGMLLYSLLFCAIYTKGVRQGGLAEGLRYGLWIGLLMSLPIFFVRWSTEALPGDYIFLATLLGFIVFIIDGGILGAVYGKVSKA